MRLGRTYRFEAAHRLAMRDASDEENWRIYGKCSREGGHGHNYEVQVVLRGVPHPDTGMVMDRGDMDRRVHEHLIERVDHRNLNDVSPFTEIESTAESQARYFFDEMKKRLPPELAPGLLLARVSESPGQWAQYGVAPAFPDAGIQDRG